MEELYLHTNVVCFIKYGNQYQETVIWKRLRRCMLEMVLNETSDARNSCLRDMINNVNKKSHKLSCSRVELKVNLRTNESQDQLQEKTHQSLANVHLIKTNIIFPTIHNKVTFLFFFLLFFFLLFFFFFFPSIFALFEGITSLSSGCS